MRVDELAIAIAQRCARSTPDDVIATAFAATTILIVEYGKPVELVAFMEAVDAATHGLTGVDCDFAIAALAAFIASDPDY